MAALPLDARVVAEDNATKASIESNRVAIDALTHETIATFDVGFCLARTPGTSTSLNCGVCSSYQNGGSACQLVAKAFLAGEATADIAIQNGGGCRTSLPAGSYSIGDAYEALPFSNTMFTVKMTGSQVKQVLEDALANFLDLGGSAGSYPYAAGLRFDVDASQTAGSRVSNLEVSPQLEAAWSPIDLSATYTVVTSNYLAGGKDGYLTFGAIAEGDKVDTYKEYAQSFIDYLTDMSGCISAIPLNEFSTQKYINPTGCDHSVNMTCIAGAECTPHENAAAACSGNFAECCPFERTFKMTILHMNDHHSYVEGPSRAFKMNTTTVLAGSGIDSVAIKYGGFPRIVTLMDQLMSSEPNVLKLHAGDALTGTLWYSLFKGRADAEVMSKACFDAFTIGNHEFDDGDDVLADFLQDLAAAGCGPQVACMYEFVSVNCAGDA